jgi:hypothetical protein
MVLAEITAEGVGITLLITFFVLVAGAMKIGKAVLSNEAGRGIASGLFKRFFG